MDLGNKTDSHILKHIHSAHKILQPSGVIFYANGESADPTGSLSAKSSYV